MADTHVHTLVILPGPVPPDMRSEWNVYYYLSSFLEGTVLQPVWSFLDRDGCQIRQASVARFNYRLTTSCWLPKPIKFFWDLLFYTFHGVCLHSKRRLDLIITYGTTRTGLAGLILKYLSGAKLIVEVPGVPRDAFVYDRQKASVAARLRNWVSSSWTCFLLNRADHCKMLFPEQLEGLEIRKDHVRSSFADLVPISQIAPIEEDDNYLLCIGVPWHLKGVDLLVEAFKRISHKYPNLILKLYGHCEDREHFSKLIAGCDRIEMGQGVSREEVIDFISRCKVFVLPSRTEAMGRVLLEAMAAKKPIVASRVGGIPYVVQHEQNGLLFDSEDVDGLVVQLTRILDDPVFADKLAQNGYAEVHERLNEARYIANYRKMVDATLAS